MLAQVGANNQGFRELADYGALGYLLTTKYIFASISTTIVSEYANAHFSQVLVGIFRESRSFADGMDRYQRLCRQHSNEDNSTSNSNNSGDYAVAAIYGPCSLLASIEVRLDTDTEVRGTRGTGHWHAAM